MMKILIGLSLVLSAQALASDCTEVTFQNRDLEAFVVNSADIGVPTLPPLVYTEETFDFDYSGNGGAALFVKGRFTMAQIGNIVTLTILPPISYFVTGTAPPLSISVQLPIPFPNASIETAFLPKSIETNVLPPPYFDYSNKYLGLAQVDVNGILTLYYQAPQTSVTWPANSVCSWDTFTVTYHVD